MYYCSGIYQVKFDWLVISSAQLERTFSAQNISIGPGDQSRLKMSSSKIVSDDYREIDFKIHYDYYGEKRCNMIAYWPGRTFSVTDKIPGTDAGLAHVQR